MVVGVESIDEDLYIPHNINSRQMKESEIDIFARMMHNLIFSDPHFYLNKNSFSSGYYFSFVVW